MPRNEAIEQINAALERLPDDRLDDLAALAVAWTRPTVYSTLSEADKAAIDAALDALERGEGESWETVKDFRSSASGTLRRIATADAAE